MSVACPACKMESPDGAAYCDFCKQPFGKKPKPKAKPADALAGVPVEKILAEPEKLLRADVPKGEAAPPWLRPVAWALLAASVAGSAVALTLLRSTYEERARQHTIGAPGQP